MKQKDLVDEYQLNLFVIRRDGQVIYQTQSKESINIQEEGQALLAGISQASEAFFSFINNSNSEGLRISIGDEKNGIYMFPLNLAGEEFFLTSIYKNHFNPAKLKFKIQLLKSELIQYISKKYQILNNIDLDKDETNDYQRREGFLFKKISEVEIDNLFNFSGN